jgi:hypothetical protein
VPQTASEVLADPRWPVEAHALFLEVQGALGWKKALAIWADIRAQYQEDDRT